MAEPLANRMTKAERADLLSLVKKREKVMKTLAAGRSAELIAEFEAEAAKIYSFNDDATWRRAHAEAQAAVAETQAIVEQRCQALGIPKEFAPQLTVQWHARGENAMKWRMDELRRVAKKRIEALEADACSRVERMSLEAQTELLSQGLDTEAAHRFLASAEGQMASFMPSLRLPDVEKMVAPVRRIAGD